MCIITARTQHYNTYKLWCMILGMYDVPINGYDNFLWCICCRRFLWCVSTFINIEYYN